jgi:hypothetical protein
MYRGAEHLVDEDRPSERALTDHRNQLNREARQVLSFF